MQAEICDKVNPSFLLQSSCHGVVHAQANQTLHGVIANHIRTLAQQFQFRTNLWLKKEKTNSILSLVYHRQPSNKNYLIFIKT